MKRPAPHHADAVILQLLLLNATCFSEERRGLYIMIHKALLLSTIALSRASLLYSADLLANEVSAGPEPILDSLINLNSFMNDEFLPYAAMEVPEVGSSKISGEIRPIDTDELQSLLTTESLKQWSEKLFLAANESTQDVGHPTRYIGTKGHNASLKLITDTLDELTDVFTYEVRNFVVLAGRVYNWTLATSKEGERIDSRPLRLTPAASPISAPVHLVRDYGCLPMDYGKSPDQRDDHTSDGKIVIVKRGKCTLGEKAELAGLAGASGLLIWDPELPEDEVFSRGDLVTPLPHHVATLGISGSSAKSLEDGEYLDLMVNSEIIETLTSNIIAETRAGDHDNVVFAGAHSDSVLAGMGANDNGSGMVSLLEIARQIAKFRVNNAVRLAWWSAEELGLRGSLDYTENLTRREAAKIRMFLDYDMMASRNYKYEIYNSTDSENPVGSTALRDMYIDWYDKHGYNWTLQPFDGRSDYVGFVNIGIPSCGIDSGVDEIKSEEEVLEFGGVAGVAYDPCYHATCDDLSNLSYEPWLVNTRLMAHSIALYATDMKHFPPRSHDYYRQREPKPLKWTTSDAI